MRAIPQIAVDFIISQEGMRLVGYADSTGLATIGAGHTGPDISIGQVITLEQAKAYLAADLQTAALRLQSRIGSITLEALTDNQFAALLSFVFNVGAAPNWTIWKVIAAKQFADVPIELNRFVYAGGKRLPGLVKRRAAEGALWMTAVKVTPKPVIGPVVPILAAAPVAVMAASHYPVLWPIIIAVMVGFVLIGVTYLIIISRKHHMATITDTATAVEAAATALAAAATELNTSAAAISTAIANAGTSAALDQPLADLATAVTSVQTAATAIKTAAGA